MIKRTPNDQCLPDSYRETSDPMTNDSSLRSGIFLLSLLFILPCISPAQDKPSGGEIELEPKYATIKWRFSIMPILSFYDANTSYLDAPKATQGLGLSAKAEFKLTPRSTTKLIVGLEYLNEGMKFDSYYFAPGHSVLYDKNYNYTHKLHISEMYFPILFKQSFGDEDRKANTMYISGGWAFRYLMGTHYNISSKTDGNTIDKGFSPMTVEHKFITENGGSALVGGMGFEHKLAGMKRAVFLEMYYRYNLSRIHYIGNNHTNNIRFRNHSFTIGVGYEF